MSEVYAADLIAKVADPRHVQHVLGGLKRMAEQLDPGAKLTQSGHQGVLVSLVVDRDRVTHRQLAELADHYARFLSSVELLVHTPGDDHDRQELRALSRYLDCDVAELGLCRQTVKALYAGGIHSVRELTQHSEQSLTVYVPGVGLARIAEIQDALLAADLDLLDP